MCACRIGTIVSVFVLAYACSPFVCFYGVALYVCLHPFPFSLSSQHVQDAWYEDGFQLEECCCKVCPAHGMVRTSRVSLEFWYWYVCCLSLRMVIHRTIGQGCNRSASFRALALQLIERPATLHQDKRCNLLMFIFLFGKDKASLRILERDALAGGTEATESVL